MHAENGNIKETQKYHPYQRCSQRKHKGKYCPTPDVDTVFPEVPDYHPSKVTDQWSVEAQPTRMRETTPTVVKIEEGEIPSQLDDQTLKEIEELTVTERVWRYNQWKKESMVAWRAMEYREGTDQLYKQRGYCYLILMKKEMWEQKEWPAYLMISDIVGWPKEWRNKKARVNITMGDKTWKKDWFFVGHVEKAWEDEEAIDWKDIEELAMGINENTRLGAANITRDQVPFPRYITRS